MKRKIGYLILSIAFVLTLITPVLAGVPIITKVTATQDPTDPSWIILEIHIHHTGAAPDHRVTAIYLVVNDSEYHAPIDHDLNQTDFVYNYTIVNVYGPTRVKIRAYCERDGWGAWWEGIVYPNATVIQLTPTPSLKFSYDMIVIATGVIVSLVIVKIVQYRAKRLG